MTQLTMPFFTMTLLTMPLSIMTGLIQGLPPSSFAQLRVNITVRTLSILSLWTTPWHFLKKRLIHDVCFM
jgi:hypothetical protein